MTDKREKRFNSKSPRRTKGDASATRSLPAPSVTYYVTLQVANNR